MTADRHVVIDVAPAPSRPHEAVFGPGLLGRLGAAAAAVAAPGPCVLVADANVAAAGHAARAETSLRAAGFRPVASSVPGGEPAKSLAAVERLWSDFAAAGLDRGGLVVAVGGGASCDAAGFAAATWMRGVPWIVAPTTLLAMADAAVGGKTAINLPAGKNLAGAVHMPLLVAGDVDSLATLGDRELRSGFAEIVKCAVLADRPRLAAFRRDAARLLGRDAALLVEEIAFAVGVKAAHVRDDADDTRGVRAMLNLGHTVAHALEAESGYGTMLHGEAVAIGLVVATRVAARRGLCAADLERDVRAALAAFGLPTDVPPAFSAAALVARTLSDKKRHAGRRRMVLPLAAGGAALTDVPDEELAAALG